MRRTPTGFPDDFAQRYHPPNVFRTALALLFDLLQLSRSPPRIAHGVRSALPRNFG